MDRGIKSLSFGDTYRFLDVSVGIRSDSHDVQKFLRSSYPRFLVNKTAVDKEICVEVNKRSQPYKACIHALDYRYLVFKTTRGFVLNCENFVSGDVERVIFNDGLVHHLSPAEIPFVIDDEVSEDDQNHIFAFVQIVLLRTVATLMPHRHLLHAAAAAWNDNGVILPAAAGHGKTMLSLALVKQGFNFLSDDVACLDLAFNNVEPFPRSVNLRRTGRGILEALLQPGSIGDSRNHGPMDIDELFPASLGRTCPLRFVFLLKGEFRLEPELRSISKRRALWQALKLSHTPVSNPGDALWRLSSIFDRARCYELRVGELSTTARLIRREVELPRGRGELYAN